jgi:hypothetical protein
LVKYLKEAKPRRVDLKEGRPPVLLFTDGACEGELWENTTFGGVIIDPWSKTFEAFGAKVPEWLLESWTDGVARQVIGQAEILPVFVGKYIWKATLAGRQTLYFIDNYSALDAYIKGSSNARGSEILLAESQKLDAEVQEQAWYGRVSSSGNPADGPSRLDFESLGMLHMFKRVDVPEGCWDILRAASKECLKRKSRE